jgi:hypothetical protein
VEAEADWDQLLTPETYLGSGRGERLAPRDRLRLNHWALAGEWAIGPENVVLDQAGGSIAYRFHARDAHYQLVRQHDAVRERTLEITFLEPGAEAYSFTFG